MSWCAGRQRFMRPPADAARPTTTADPGSGPPRARRTGDRGPGLEPGRTVADAMRRAGIDGPLTVAQARSWRAMTSEPPGWMAELFAETAARRSQREHREQRRIFEAEHATLLLADEVEQRLLAGRRIRGDEAERLAADMAFRAYKELPPRCQTRRPARPGARRPAMGRHRPRRPRHLAPGRANADRPPDRLLSPDTVDVLRSAGPAVALFGRPRGRAQAVVPPSMTRSVPTT